MRCGLMGRDALREGYLRVLHGLYDPKAYFASVDSLFLEGGLKTGAARDAHLRSRPFRRFNMRKRCFTQVSSISSCKLL
jgi:Domain of unknown function (DUF4070)